MNLSRIAPIMNATTGYNSKNPAEGPANTPMPPRPPDNSGKPATTNNKKTITLNVPYLRPKITPAKKIPMFWSTIGTEKMVVELPVPILK